MENTRKAALGLVLRGETSDLIEVRNILERELPDLYIVKELMSNGWIMLSDGGQNGRPTYYPPPVQDPRWIARKGPTDLN